MKYEIHKNGDVIKCFHHEFLWHFMEIDGESDKFGARQHALQDYAWNYTTHTDCLGSSLWGRSQYRGAWFNMEYIP